MKPKQLVAALVGVAVVIVAAAYTTHKAVSPPGRPDIVGIDDDDPRLKAVITEARNRWPEFVRAFGEKKPGRVCAVKGPFPVNGSEKVEHMWVQVAAIDSATIRGTLMDEPYDDVAIKKGDPAMVKVADVEDWVYGEPGKDFVGGFSQKLMEEIRGK